MAEPDDDPTDGGQPKVEIATAQRTGQDDAADPKKVRGKARAVQSALRDTVDFWSMVMETQQGRREVWRLLHEGDGHPFAVRFGTSGGFPQPEASWLEAGKQGHGFDQYLYLLTLAPELTTLMLTENEPRLIAAMQTLREKPRRARKRTSQPLR